ncbi:alpha,alpha-trehalose-phosphate synthase [UDP-forming] 1-like protein [Tanacetum coccineum]
MQDFKRNSTRDTSKSATNHQTTLLSLHLKMILENVNNNVGELVGQTVVLEDASPRKDEINKDKSKCGRSFRLFVVRMSNKRGIAVPTRTDVPEYQKLTSQVHEIVGRINGRFRTLTTVPIHHLDRSLDFLALCALYAVTASIGQALTMSAEEREKRHLHNFLHVTTHTAQNWAETFLKYAKMQGNDEEDELEEEEDGKSTRIRYVEHVEKLRFR